MPMKNLVTQSGNFTGTSEEVLSQVSLFLKDLKKTHPHSTGLNLVHALVFPKNQSEEQTRQFNKKLGQTYTECHFSVLGGDTSSGLELSVFISAIIF